MTIIRRIRTLITADIHGMLDLIEDPVDGCKQAIREMEDELATLQVSKRAIDERLIRLDDQKKRIASRIEENQQQIAVCLTADDNSLLKASLRRKLEQEKLLLLLEKQGAATRMEADRISKTSAEFEDRLSSIREKFECFTGGSETVEHDRFSPDHGENLHVTDEELEVAFLKIRQEHGKAQIKQGSKS